MAEAGPRFDVFLSHNSKDKPAVIALAERLKAEGLNVWLDAWELRPGHPWQEALEEIIETTGAAAVLVGADGIGPWEDAEMRACLDEFARRRLPVIPVLLPGCPARPTLPLLLRRFTWVDLRSGPEEAGFRRLVWGITGRKPAEQSRPERPEPPVPPAAGQPAAREPAGPQSPINSRFRRWFAGPWVMPALVMLFLGGAVVLWLSISTVPIAVTQPLPSEPKPEPEMVNVPGGEFWMGSNPAGDPDAQEDERPRHKVKIEPFRIGKYEVTQGQWRAVMGSNPSHFSGCGDDCPVESVSFDGVGAFIRKLNADTGQHYRLLTEAEWEHACRSGGLEQKYCGGEDLDRLAWYGGNAGEKTHPVGGKAPNGLGLYDMSGNVREWTCSAYTETYDGGEIRCADGGRRVIRGGSWFDPPGNLRSAFRLRNSPDFRNLVLGFRLAQD